MIHRQQARDNNMGTYVKSTNPIMCSVVLVTGKLQFRHESFLLFNIHPISMDQDGVASQRRGADSDLDSESAVTSLFGRRYLQVPCWCWGRSCYSSGLLHVVG